MPTTRSPLATAAPAGRLEDPARATRGRGRGAPCRAGPSRRRPRGSRRRCRRSRPRGSRRAPRRRTRAARRRRTSCGGPGCSGTTVSAFMASSSVGLERPARRRPRAVAAVAPDGCGSADPLGAARSADAAPCRRRRRHGCRVAWPSVDQRGAGCGDRAPAVPASRPSRAVGQVVPAQPAGGVDERDVGEGLGEVADQALRPPGRTPRRAGRRRCAARAGARRARGRRRRGRSCAGSRPARTSRRGTRPRAGEAVDGAVVARPVAQHEAVVGRARARWPRRSRPPAGRRAAGSRRAGS